MATMTQEEIFDKVKTTLVDALSVDDEEVTESAKLQADLGAESIDFLDIAFRLEKLFNIKIPQDELFPQQIISNPAYVENRKLNAAGWRRSRRPCPTPICRSLRKTRKSTSWATCSRSGRSSATCRPRSPARRSTGDPAFPSRARKQAIRGRRQNACSRARL